VGGSVYRWLDHTAELELELEAATERAVLSDALDALRELLEGDETAVLGEVDDDRLVHRAVRATAGDRPALLAAWLEELLFLSESEAFIPIAVQKLSLEDSALTAIVSGRVGEPRPLVKAVTYHRLQFEPAAHGYRARVVFDV
jgi:SHS2 domain-containing protein